MTSLRYLLLLLPLVGVTFTPHHTLAQDLPHRDNGDTELSAKDIDRILLEDSDTGVAEAQKTLKLLNRELETRIPNGVERRSSDRMARSMSKRLRKPETTNWNAPEPKKKKRGKE